ncbi:MAG: response regulator [Verrucomicrobia bacterium]|nr:response regulator [Verrucomicrobiota bacterium]
MKIGTQLRLRLGLVLALVIGLGALARVQTDQLWLQTKELYEHPLQVRQAIGGLEVDIEKMSRHVRDLLLSQTDKEIMASLQSIEIDKADAEAHMSVFFDRYLGPREDITQLRAEFIKWNALRDETIRLIRAEKKQEAEARIRPGGVQNEQAEVVRRKVKIIDEFARNKSDQFYRSATELNDTLNRQLAGFVVVILLLALVIAWLVLKTIKEPLAHLLAAAEQFRLGKLEARSGYASSNEFGALSAAFNAMADAIQTQIQISESATQLASIMLREEEVHAFCRELLKALLQYTGSQVGAVYFMNQAQTAFEHFESIGLAAGGRAAFSATGLEGELGPALATRRIQHITNIPADTRFSFSAVSGEFTPREILTIPVLSDHTVSAVISLASVRAYDAQSVRLVNDIWSLLTARMNGVLAFRTTKELAESLEHQNRELDAQKTELTSQSAELTHQNMELEMQKKQLDEANRLKSVFLSNMSHELRTPLNSVIALSGVLSRRLAGTIPVEEFSYLEVIERNGKNLLALINDILDLSRIEAGREEIRLGQFSLRLLAGEVAAMIEPQAQEKGIVLCNQVADDLPPVTSDPAMIRHILQNLVGNAVKFTETGSVDISARLAGDMLHIAVTDTGIGIAPDKISHIFEEFRQADDSVSREYGGTGLGLAIAKKYAALVHGGITVESMPGQGSTFTLRLPLTLSLPAAHADAATLPTDSSGTATARQSATAGQNPCILLVEDSEPAIIQMSDILTAHGYRLLVARNGKEALAHLELWLPDVAILDLMMPEMDGFEVLKTIRGTEKCAHLPVLILTAKHVTRDELSFLKNNGIHQLIQKGNVSRTELLTAVESMFALPPEKPAPAAQPRTRRQRSGKPVILVVEDNPDSMKTMRALLQDTYGLLEAVDGRVGVEQARTHLPDLILMDIALPVMNGIEALHEIRKDEALRHIPVVAVTASAMKGDQETILACGFDGYLTKPVDEELLQKTIQEKLD